MPFNKFRVWKQEIPDFCWLFPFFADTSLDRQQAQYSSGFQRVRYVQDTSLIPHLYLTMLILFCFTKYVFSFSLRINLCSQLMNLCSRLMNLCSWLMNLCSQSMNIESVGRKYYFPKQRNLVLMFFVEILNTVSVKFNDV